MDKNKVIEILKNYQRDFDNMDFNDFEVICEAIKIDSMFTDLDSFAEGVNHGLDLAIKVLNKINEV